MQSMLYASGAACVMVYVDPPAAKSEGVRPCQGRTSSLGPARIDGYLDALLLDPRQQRCYPQCNGHRIN